MKRIYFLILSVFLSFQIFGMKFYEEKIPGTNQMVVYVTAFDWGAGAEKLVLNNGKVIKKEDFEKNIEDFEVEKEKRSASNYDRKAGFTEDELTVKTAYLCDGKGNKVDGNSKYFAIELPVDPTDQFCDPLNRSVIRGINDFAGYRVTNDSLDLEIYKVAGFVNPLASKFDTSEFIKNEISLNSAFYVPENIPSDKKIPLIIWLHGISEGGKNAYVPLIGIKSVNLASEQIQQYFENGAAVLVPQCPTAWLETTTLDSNGLRVWEVVDIQGTMNKYVSPIKSVLSVFTTIPVDEKTDTTPTATTSYYTEVLMDLIKEFISNHPEIDTNRIYIGGCSAGGYMTLNMLIENPDYFAAAFPTCEVYLNSKITDEKIQQLAKVPLWFVQAENDNIAKAANYVSPTFQRLRKAGGKNLHLSMYEGVFDETGMYINEEDQQFYEYNGHYSWIYTLNNDPKENGKTLFQWLSEQSR